MDDPVGFKGVIVAQGEVFPSFSGCQDDGISDPDWHGIMRRGIVDEAGKVLEILGKNESGIVAHEHA